VFHALPIARGKSMSSGHWARDLLEFYGPNIFMAETSATSGGLDSLLQPRGPIKKAQDLAARAFGARQTFFVTNGTSTANKIVAQALIQPGDIVLVVRDCHKSHHYALVLAGAIALLNALVMAQLTIQNPVSGGAYRYGQRYIDPRAGFLAGWFFLVGKTASAAAISAIAGRYLWPENPTLVAVGLLAVFALANISGLRTTAAISLLVAVIVVGFLITTLIGASSNLQAVGLSGEASGWGVLPAAGLIFFAFAGYARMATLGEEVRNPVTVLPRVIVVTLLGVLALYGAIEMMSEDADKQLLYIRSIIESADKGLGSLPGDIAEKFDPFLMPLYDKLEEIVAPQDVAHLKATGRISAVPINFLRGASWTKKIIIADESQNFSAKELITLITRIGEGSKIIICGDPMQSDIGKSKSGFMPMLQTFNDEESKLRGIQTFMFSKSDIVRSEILKFIVEKLEGGDFHV
jgi:hypothetical protein